MTPILKMILGNYALARDRARRTIRLPARFNDSELLSFANNMHDSINASEPSSFREAVNSKFA